MLGQTGSLGECSHGILEKFKNQKNNDLIVYIIIYYFREKTIDLSTTLLVVHLPCCIHYTQKKKLHDESTCIHNKYYVVTLSRT